MADLETITTGAPLSRRRLLRGAAAGAGASVALAVPAALAGADTDAELLALEAEIERLYAAAAKITAERITPLDDEYLRAWHSQPWLSKEERWERVKRFGIESGREAAVEENCRYVEEACNLTERMFAIVAASRVGRAAQLRVLFRHVMEREWEGPAQELDWDVSLARRLFLRTAGLTEADLGGVS